MATVLIYGNPGNGKTTLANKLRTTCFHYYRYWHLDHHYPEFATKNFKFSVDRNQLNSHWDNLPKQNKIDYFSYLKDCMKSFQDNLVEGYYLKDYVRDKGDNTIFIEMRNWKMYYNNSLIGDKK